jgi:hypothetical protein
VEWAFGACLRGEAWLLRHVSLPLGASIVAVATKD